MAIMLTVAVWGQEELRSDKRQALADALAAKLAAKYARQDPQFAASIAAMTSRLFLHSAQRVLEADVVAFETVVRKMSLEREQRRPAGVAGVAGVAGAAGVKSGAETSRAPAAAASSAARPADGPNARSATAAGAATAAAFQAQDEWVLLNALTLVEFEDEQAREQAAAIEKKRLQRAWLDAQGQDKASRAAGDHTQAQREFSYQQRDVAQWREQESAKKAQAQELALRVRREQDAQLQQQKAQAAAREAQRQQDEADEVARVQRELQRLDDEAARKRSSDRARMKVLQHENARVQQRKHERAREEQREDVALMEAYAQRLVREDDERLRRLQSRLTLQDRRQHGAVASLQAELRAKALDDERRAAEFQRGKDAAAQAREQALRDARRAEALERQEFLRAQHAQKQARERQEVEDDLTFARGYHAEGRAALAAQQQQVQRVRERNVQFQSKLVMQMAEQQEGVPSSPLRLPRALMNSRERHINAALLHKLEDDDVGRKVREKLSPVRGPGGGAPAISTSFY